MAGGFTWVRWDSKLFTSSTWLALPMDVRGVFSHLILLAIRDPNNIGLVKERKPEEIALLLRCPPATVKKALDILSAPEMEKIRLTAQGWWVPNIASFLPPDRMRSHAHRAATLTPDHGTRGEPLATTKTTSTDEDDDMIATLQSTKGWVPDDETDLDYLAQWRADFPSVDLAEEAKKFAAWHSDRPLRKNLRLAFRNWLKNAVVFEAERRARRSESPTGSLEEQLRELE